MTQVILRGHFGNISQFIIKVLSNLFFFFFSLNIFLHTVGCEWLVGEDNIVNSLVREYNCTL